MLFAYIKKAALFIKGLFNKKNEKEEYIEEDEEISDDEEYEERPSLIERIKSFFKREKTGRKRRSSRKNLLHLYSFMKNSLKNCLIKTSLKQYQVLNF